MWGFNKKKDFDPIQSLQTLERDYGPQVTKEVVQIFIMDYPGKIRTLKDSITTGQMDRTLFMAHNIRSGCLSLGLSPMTELCEAIETKGKTLSTEKLFHLSNELENNFQKISRAFKDHFKI